MEIKYRLHPLMAVNFIKPFLFILILPLFKGLLQYILYKQADSIIMLEITAFILCGLLVFLRFKRFSLIIRDESIVINYGIISKKTAVIQKSRISSINQSRNIIQYLLGAATLSINTEAGKIKKADYEFVLYSDDAQQFIELLYGKENRKMHRFPIKRQILAAALTSSSFAGLFLAVPIIYKSGNLFNIALSKLLLSKINSFANEISGYFPPITNTITLILIISYIISFIYILISSLRFRFYIGERYIEIKKGIFVVKKTVFKIENINNISVEQSPLMRIFNLFSVHASVAGFENRKNKAIIFPLVKRKELSRLLCFGDTLNTNFTIFPCENVWIFLRPVAITGLIILCFGICCVLLFPLFSRFILFTVMVVLLVVAYFATLRIYNCFHGAVVLGKKVTVNGTKGFITRKICCAKNNIAIIKLFQTPFARKRNTCSFKLHILSETSSNVKVRNLSVSEAENIVVYLNKG